MKRNLVMNILLTVSSVVFPLITWPYVARVLTSAGTGKVALAVSVITYFTMFSQLGIPTYGIRACAKVHEDREELTNVTCELLIINLIMCVIAYALLGAAILLVPKLRAEKALYLVVSVSILLNALGMEWLYKGLEQYTYITVRSVIFKLIALGATFLLVRSKSDYVIYGGISIFAVSASGVMNFVHARHFLSRPRLNRLDPMRHMKAVALFFAMACATTVYTNLDVIMLGFMKTDRDVGWYNAAVKVKLVLVSVVSSVGAVVLPRASWYAGEGRFDDFWKVAGKAMHFVFLLAAPLVLYFIFFAREAILLLSGSDYLPALGAMRWIMPTVLLIGVTNILGIQILIPLGREQVVLYSEITGAVADLLFNLVLIPFFGADGAAIGTLAAETAVLGVQLWGMWERHGTLFASVPWIKIAAGLAVGSLLSLWVLRMNLGTFPRLLVSAILFFGAYGAVLILTKDPVMFEALGFVKNAAGIGKKDRGPETADGNAQAGDDSGKGV